MQSSFRVLLVYPTTPVSQWELQYSLPMISARSSSPPLGLATIAALMPEHWEIVLHDQNVEDGLTDEEIATFDVVMLSGMHIHRLGIEEVLSRCKRLSIPTVVGGPFSMSEPEAKELADATAIFLGEAEDSRLFSRLIRDAENRTLQKIYKPDMFGEDSRIYPDLSACPVPRWDIVKVDRYAAMTVQATRGCMWKCNFCTVSQMFGRRTRYKSPEQITAELDALLACGHRGGVMFVDDNFGALQIEALKISQAVLEWQKANGRPYSFYTQTDVKLLTKYDELASTMRDAGFHTVLVGFEDTSDAAVKEMKKGQNMGVNIPKACAEGRSKGILTFPALIVGLRSHTTAVFEEMRRVIRESNCSVVMISMLNAIPGTPLAKEYEEQGHVIDTMMGDNVSISNIIPYGMSRLELHEGFDALLRWAYLPKQFFSRAIREVWQWKASARRKPIRREFVAMMRSFRIQGFRSDYKFWYWLFLITILLTNPWKFPRAVAIAIYYVHFRKYVFEHVSPQVEAVIRQIKSESAQIMPKQPLSAAL